MSYISQYSKLPPHLQTDLVSVASNTAFRQLLMEEVGVLQRELLSLNVPEELTTASAIGFCKDYQRRREMKSWLESLLATLEQCQEDFLERQAKQE